MSKNYLDLAEEAIGRSNSLDALEHLIAYLRSGQVAPVVADEVPVSPAAPAVADAAGLKDDIAYLAEKAAEAHEEGNEAAADKANGQANLLRSAESIVESTTAPEKRTPAKKK